MSSVARESAVFPLTQAFLPGDAVVLRVFEPRYLAMFARTDADTSNTFVSVLIERGPEVGGGDRRFALGVQVQVDMVAADSGTLVVSGTATHAVEVVEWLPDDPWPRARVVSVDHAPERRETLRDAASALTVLAQSVRSLLARHGVDAVSAPGAVLSSLSTVAGGRWHGGEPVLHDVDVALWSVVRALPCGPLDRYSLLAGSSVKDRVGILRRIVEHTDEVLAFGRDARR
ncbi:MAG: LON peptidase substrate-binding domain-containing protein [Acidimicrobiales bacterium]